MFKTSAIVREDMERIFASDSSGWSFFSGKTILITGATGMIPSYLVTFLLYLNEEKTIPLEIIAFVRNRDKAERLFKQSLQNPSLKIISGDINSAINLPGSLDYIIHGASLASPQYYHTDPVGTILPNVLGTYHLLELAREKKVTCLVFLSSGAVYGNVKGKLVSEDSGGWVDPLAPGSCYAESKRMGETMCAAWQRQYRVPARMVRIRHTFGPTMDLESDKRVFTSFVSSVLKGKDIVLRSDGSREIEFLYITDAVTGILRVLGSGKDGEAYNLSNSRERISVLALARQLAESAKIDVRFTDVLVNDEKESQQTDTARLEALGWMPRISILEGFNRTIDALRSTK